LKIGVSVSFSDRADQKPVGFGMVSSVTQLQTDAVSLNIKGA
jgi:hypothetical protein